jgi:hypothetical protein
VLTTSRDLAKFVIALEGKLIVKDHEIVDYETLQTEIDGRALFLTLYRDASGEVAWIESTN